MVPGILKRRDIIYSQSINYLTSYSKTNINLLCASISHFGLSFLRFNDLLAMLSLIKYLTESFDSENSLSIDEIKISNISNKININKMNFIKVLQLLTECYQSWVKT